MRPLLVPFLLFLASPAAADMFQNMGNATAPAERGMRVDVRAYGAVCDGTADDLAAFNAASAALASNPGGMIGVPGYPRICRLSAPFVGGTGVGLVGLEPILPSYNNPGTDRRIGPHIKCATLNQPCVTVGSPSVGTGAVVKNLIVSYVGVPAAGAKAIIIQGYNSVCENVAIYNAYDGITFAGGLSSRCSNLFTGAIVHDHIVQDGSPEVYLNGVRLGTNGSDVASNAFLGVTGNNPNGLMCNQCQLNLGSLSPSYLWHIHNVTNQVDGIYQLTNSVVDMSLGTCAALIKTDATAGVSRLQIADSYINAPACPLIDQTTQAAAPQRLVVTNNPLLAVSTINLDTGSTVGTVFDIRGNPNITGSVTLNSGSASARGNFSDNVVSGNLTVTSTGAPWPSLQLMNNIIGGTLTDTAATGKIFYAGAGVNWTPVVKLGATTVSTSAAAGTATRQPDGSIKYHINVVISNENAGTGALTITGAPYQCADNGRAIIGGTGYLGLTGVPIIGAATGGGGFTFSQSGATGYTALNETNTQVGTVVVADVVCPAT